MVPSNTLCECDQGNPPWLSLLASVVATCLVFLATPAAAHAQNQVTLETVDEGTGESVPARLEFTKSGAKLKRDRKIPAVGERWLIEGVIPIQPPPGDYEFLAQRGPEFKSIRGGFTVERGARDSILIELERSIDMHAESWFSGDLSAELESAILHRWQFAEALDMAVEAHPIADTDPPPKSAASKPAASKKQVDAPKSASPELTGYGWTARSLEFRTSTAGLALHRAPTELAVPETLLAGESTAAMYTLLQQCLGNDEVLCEITQLAGRDVPVLLAHPRARCARLLSVSNRPDQDDALKLARDENAPEFGNWTMTLGKERLAIPILAPLPTRDRIRFQGGRGAGALTEFLYWQILEAGLRLSPTAASGFGRVDSHLGYNRVYAFIESEPSADAWWQAVAGGRTTVTNGPLLRTMVNGGPPGTVQSSYREEPIPLDIAVSLAVREPVDYLDVIFNGETLYSAKLEDHYRRGEFPDLSIDRSGWLVVRVITSGDSGYRMATTAPFYFEFNGQPRISRSAVDLFQRWLERCEQSMDVSEKEHPSTQASLELARTFWTSQLEKANAP